MELINATTGFTWNMAFNSGNSPYKPHGSPAEGISFRGIHFENCYPLTPDSYPYAGTAPERSSGEPGDMEQRDITPDLRDPARVLHAPFITGSLSGSRRPRRFSTDSAPRISSTHLQSRDRRTGRPRYSLTPDEILSCHCDRKLRKLLESGRYVYADERFCLHEPAYALPGKDGIPHLTTYAINHEGECCLPFREYRPDTEELSTSHRQNPVARQMLECEGDARTGRVPAGRDYWNTVNIIRLLPPSPGGTLAAHMERQDISVEELADRANMSETTIKNIRANKCYSLDFSYFIAVALALNLDPLFSMDLVQKTRYRFDDSPESMMYLFLLTARYYAGIEVCNEELTARRFKPLTKRSASPDPYA